MGTEEEAFTTDQEQYDICADPAQNQSWIACNNAAHTSCGTDQSCLTTKLQACRTEALAACKQVQDVDDTAAINTYNKNAASCDKTAEQRKSQCPPSGLCNDDADCQDTNPGDTCSDGKCVSGGCDCAEGYKCCPNGSCYPTASTCPPSPIVLDTFDEGFHLTSPGNGVRFRVLPGGPLSQMSWTDANWRNGWLALDRNGNGTIDDLTELFGNLTPQPPSNTPNGFLALAVFDDPANGGNGNGFIDPGDAVYSRLRVWIDANHNGISESKELHRLQELGIFKIGLTYHETPFVDQFGNQFRYKGTVWDGGGNERDICYDVFLELQVN